MLSSLAASALPFASSSDTPTLAYSLGYVLGVLLVYAILLAIVMAFSGLFWAGTFAKAGQPKLAAFIPFYNNWTLVKIAGRPVSHFWLQFIPYAGLIWSIGTLHDVAKSFGKGAGTTVGLLFVPVVFATMLSYGSAKYRGPAYLGQGQPMPVNGYAQQFQAQQPTQPQYTAQYPQAQPTVPPGYFAAPTSPDAPQPHHPQPPYGSGPTQQP